MAIIFENNKFHLFNKSLSYVIEIGKDLDVFNTYFGAPIDCRSVQAAYISTPAWQPYKVVEGSNLNSGVMPCEYPTAASPDFRSPAFEAETENGVNTFRFKYSSYEISEGKPALKGLPAVYTENNGEAQTLKLITRDEYAGLEIHLYYTVFEDFSAVCRHSEIVNVGEKTVKITNAQSVSLDFPQGQYDYVHLSGAWAREKQYGRAEVTLGVQGFQTRTGASSANENPFMLFGDRGFNETSGNVYGISLVYSGNHKFQIECISDVTPRVQAGINPFMFSWELKAGESFVTPEAVIAYSNKGVAEVSKTFHRLYRTRLCRGKHRDIPRPILVNNWEGTYFDFNREKLLGIADMASQIGLELFVLDDGWFGKRDNDRCSLGDWFVNEEKLGGDIKSFAEEINKRGLKFGLWLEPEMISEDSDLYRAHPDWVISVPDKTPFLSRHQLILDYTKPEVRDYIVKTVSDILANANIEYVKWDKNRYTTEPYSDTLPPHRQGEYYHRYILGLYDVMERITSAFPEILFESCSGGGARNDAGMLYYMPQTWISDDTDAVERQYIQYGASLVYPVSSWGAHVSAVPNHQTGRTTSLGLRGTVAMNGAFGYELDLTKISDKEKEIMKGQIEFYKENRELVMNGDYYRLLSPFEGNYSAWSYVSQDKSKCLVYFALTHASPSRAPIRLKLRGLAEDKVYNVDGKEFTGQTLMNYGINITTSGIDSLIIKIN